MVKIKTDKQIKFHQYLDAKGLNCPLPILKTKLLLQKMKLDEILLVEATDPHSQIDFEAYCARTNHILLKANHDNGIHTFLIKRTKDPLKV